MGVWIMSIVGVICLGILLEIVLPEGQTAKYVKGAFSLLVVFVIAMPLPNLLGKEWKLDLSGSTFTVDEEFISSTHAAYTVGMEKSLERTLLENGYECTVTIRTKDGSPIIVEGVEIEVHNFKEQVAAKVREDVKKIIADKFDISKDSVGVSIKSS